jgi:hypothetical protein
MSSIRLKYSHKVPSLDSEQRFLLNKAQLLSTPLILNFLDDNELLNYRLTCQVTYKATQKISGLYENQSKRSSNPIISG